MEAHRTRTRWTYAEFARLPSEGGSRNEVIAGDLVVTPAPGRRHQRIVTDLVTVLNQFVRTHGLGEVFAAPFDVLLAEGDYLEPDIVFVSAARTHLLSDRGVEGAPDLVIEVTSPSTASRDRGAKLERYRHFGVGQYWIVDPDAGALELWNLQRPEPPTRLEIEETLRWSPAGAPASLEVDVREILGEE